MMTALTGLDRSGIATNLGGWSVNVIRQLNVTLLLADPSLTLMVTGKVPIAQENTVPEMMPLTPSRVSPFGRPDALYVSGSPSGSEATSCNWIEALSALCWSPGVASCGGRFVVVPEATFDVRLNPPNGVHARTA